MATQVSWADVMALLAEQRRREQQARLADALRWELLETSAHLATARSIIDAPIELEVSESDLLDSLETDAQLSVADRDIVADLLGHRRF